MQKLTAGVAQLDAGGSTLYKGIDTLSAGVSQLYSSTNESFAKATAGINAESYVLYDTKGIPVRSGIINAAQTKVNVQTLNSGIYALLVKTSEGITNKRILKQ